MIQEYEINEMNGKIINIESNIYNIRFSIFELLFDLMQRISINLVEIDVPVLIGGKTYRCKKVYYDFDDDLIKVLVQDSDKKFAWTDLDTEAMFQVVQALYSHYVSIEKYRSLSVYSVC